MYEIKLKARKLKGKRRKLKLETDEKKANDLPQKSDTEARFYERRFWFFDLISPVTSLNLLILCWAFFYI